MVLDAIFAVRKLSSFHHIDPNYNDMVYVIPLPQHDDCRQNKNSGDVSVALGGFRAAYLWERKTENESYWTYMWAPRRLSDYESGAHEVIQITEDVISRAYDRWDSYEQYLNSATWKEKKRIFWENNPEKCALCGETDKKLHVHHNDYPDTWGEADPEEDSIALCASCHTIFHSTKGE